MPEVNNAQEHSSTETPKNSTPKTKSNNKSYKGLSFNKYQALTFNPDHLLNRTSCIRVIPSKESVSNDLRSHI